MSLSPYCRWCAHRIHCVATPQNSRKTPAAPPNLPNPLNLRARVVRLIDTMHADDLSRDIGIAFVDVPQMAQERIIRFALDIQRERRRRGMM